MAAATDTDVWWARALLPHPAQWVPKPGGREETELRWRTVKKEGPYEVYCDTVKAFKGTVYTDASGEHSKCKRRRRVGIAAVSMRDDFSLDTVARAM